MKWDLQLAFTVRRGRKRVFRIEQIFPFFRKFRDAHYQHARSCYDKSRFTSERAALHAEWFKKNRDKAYPHQAYKCEVCDGWHITTVRDENGKKLEKQDESVHTDVRSGETE